MRPGTRVAAGLVLALASVVALGFLTRVTWSAGGEDRAELRLTWRARAAPEAECRRLSDEEKAALPAHMRRDEVCEGRVASYRLEVRVDGALRHASVVHGSGARGDRPLYVLDAIPLAPGRHDVEVVFERVGEGGDEERNGGLPHRLELREWFELEPGDVALVTYDATARRLVLR